MTMPESFSLSFGIAMDTSDEARSGAALDGCVPAGVVSPASEEETRALVCEASVGGIALVPRGGGTGGEQGNPLRADQWFALSSSLLGGIADYSPEDMVLTARAGATLAEVQAAAAAHRQYLPIDCPFPEKATMGGITACNRQGLWRPLFGTPKDRILGIRIALADGTVVRGGGKVVKNVAGFDLCHLFTGSRGSLGFITEVTYKTSPLPERREHLAFSAPNAVAAAQAALDAHTARRQPLYLTTDIVADRAILYAGLAGGDEAVGWQASQISDLLVSRGLQPIEPPISEALLRDAVFRSDAELLARIVARPSEVPSLLDRLAPIASRIVAHVPTGILDLEVSQASHGAVRDAELASGPYGIHWRRIPYDLLGGRDAFGTLSVASLHRGIKRSLDPNSLFSPGRFAGGL